MPGYVQIPRLICGYLKSDTDSRKDSNGVWTTYQAQVFHRRFRLSSLANGFTRFYTTSARHRGGPNTNANLSSSRKMLLVTLLWSAGLALGKNLVRCVIFVLFPIR